MRALAALAPVALLSLVAASTACANVLGIEDTVRAADDQDSGPPPVGGDWTCVGKVPVETPATDTIIITAQIVDFATGAAPTGADLKVEACGSKTDRTCATKLAETTMPADGNAEISIPITGGKGFNGYLRVTGPGFVPYLWYFSRPVATSRAFPLQVLRVEALEDPSAGLLSIFKLSPDDNRGHLAVQVTDCKDDPAPNVDIQVTGVDDQSKKFYFNDGVPTDTVDRTDALGLGGYWNVPRGTVTVNGVPDALGTSSGANTLIIEPRTLTTIRMLPN